MALIRQNPLIRPAGFSAGFDPSHPASNGTIFTAVASGNNFINANPGLYGTPQIGTITGTPTASIDPIIGPSVLFGSGNKITFSSNSAPIGPGNTIACVCMVPAGLNTGIFSSSDFRYEINALGNTFRCDGANSSLAFVGATTPYFLASSFVSTTNNVFVMAALNGSQPIQTATVGNGASIVAGPTSWAIGFEASFGTYFTGKVAAVMGSNQVMSMSQLLGWARDPWAFWYPRAKNVWLKGTAAAGGAFLAAWARNSNLPVIGTGTY